MNQHFSWASLAGLKTKKRYIAAALASVIALTGCDNTDDTSKKDTNIAAENKSTVENPTKTVPLATENKSATKLSKEEMIKRYAGKELTILDASELQLDGASAIVVTFSVPLEQNQDFSQFLNLVDVKSGKLDGAWELSDNQMELRFRHIPPSRELNLTVNTGIKAVNERTITQPFEKKLQTAQIIPTVGFASKGSLLPSKVAQGLPVIALNVDKVDVNFFRIDEKQLPQFLAMWQYRSNYEYWYSEEFLNKTELAYTGRFDLNPTKNTRETVLLPLKEIKELQQDGVYLAIMQKAGSYSYQFPATVFTLSDIGVSLHSYQDQVDVFTQSLAKGSALKGVELRILDEKGQLVNKATTDGDGHAKLDKLAGGKLLLATLDGQTSMIDLTQPALDLSEFDISGPVGYAKQFFVFGPRDLYRPGELLLVNGLLRDGDGQPIKAQPVKVDVLKTDGQVVRSFVWQPEQDHNGLYQYQYEIPKSAETGGWSLRFDLGDGSPLRYYKFNVEDFMPERMALEMSAQEKPILNNEPVEFDIQGRYLYGAPAAGNELQGQIFIRPDREAVAKLPGFEFGFENEEGLQRKLDEFDLTLNDSGETVIAVPQSNWESLRSPIKVIAQASLLEAGGRPVTRRAEQAVWPAKAMVGIRPLFNKKEIYDYRTDRYTQRYNVDENSLAEFELVFADAAGNKLAAENLTARLVYERRDYFWSWSESGGWTSNYDQKDLMMANENIKIEKDGTAKVSFPVDWGSFRLEVINEDNKLVSSLQFWAGYSWQDNAGGNGAIRPDQVKLSLNKPAYLPGEKAKVRVESPKAGKGYILLESSSGPLWWQEIDVPEKGMEIEVPVNKEWARHDLYITAVVVRPGDDSKEATVKRAIGVLHLPLADENRKIGLSLTAPTKMRPNQDLTVKVKATAQDGKPLPEKVNVLLSAVDTGVLNITDFKTPNPYEAFFGRKRYGVDQYDVYGHLIEGQGKLANLRFGGDSEEAALERGGMKPLTEVQIIAEQAQPVTLDKNGEGEITLPIPDFNGELRVMAQAWNDKDFGHADSKVVVAAPLITQMSMPRFMAGGDKSYFALDLTNTTDNTQNVTVTFKASGMVKLDGATSKELSLVKGKRTTVTLPVRADYGYGEGQVSMTINGINIPGESLKEYSNSWKVGVRPAQPAETLSYAIAIEPGEQWTLPTEELRGLSPDTLEGQVLLTSRPPLQIARYIRELFAYPYGCLEQTISGLYPSLYSSQAELTKLGVKSQTDDDRRKAIEIGIPHLLSMQRPDGSFSLWDRNGREEYWLTAYATDFLNRAHQRGYSVPQDALVNANSRLLSYLQDGNQINYPYTNNPDASRFAAQAYAGLVLATQQKAPLGALRQLYSRANESNSGLPLVQLGIALNLMGDKARGDSAIIDGLKKQRSRYSYDGDYGSTIRDDAMIVALLNEHQLMPKSRDQKLQILSNNLVSQQYFSTQESNALYLAGRYYVNDSETPWKAVINGQEPPMTSDKPVNEFLSKQQLQTGYSIENAGTNTLYSRLNVVGYPMYTPTPSSNVLSVKRTYLDLQGQPITLDRLRSGEMVVVKLEVNASQMVPDALVVDLLPAGLELENQNLANSSANLSETAPNLQEVIDDMQQAQISHMEYRDDRFVAAVEVQQYKPTTLVYLARAVTPGVYNIPVPQVESMYVPEWRAVGNASGQLEIVR
ncbi:alpha-2-macroglobulin [Providencia vermicola]|uniref:Alpha-2-macroglobulin n=1 Tax=Providencia vermicola TaxID=333965 RepID=A0AAX3S1K9_9GAMM|nr:MULTISPECIES: alpha-2-macroglobulin [Providencia]ELX8378330.1 alpha-2-macroglobulin family protein [Providencia stuartii]EMD5257537.1 alpha-2-macroglobulin family protein [Providencia stuartii]USB35649.1 alpha-2-macroglobulin family protein [Providencia vermicola]WFC08156.1 alpha-2-macroglobulin [Providencia vermicola]